MTTEVINNGVVAGADSNPSAASSENAPSPASAASSFLDTLPEDLKTDKSLSTFKDVASLAKSYSEINKLMGKKITDLSSDELKTITTKFGAPEKPEDYEIELLGESAKDPIMLDIAKDLHAAGLNKDQAKAIVKSLSSKIDSTLASIDAEAKSAKIENDKAIMEAFGVDLDQNLKSAEKALLHFGGKEFLDLAKNDVKNIAAPLLKILAKVGNSIKEDVIIGKGTGGEHLTKESVIEKINSNLKNPEFMKVYTNPSHPKFNEYNEEMNKLYIQKNS